MQLALYNEPSLWREVSDKAPFAADLYDGHYSRQTPGSPQVLAPGFHLMLWHETRTGCAMWGVVVGVFREVMRFRNSVFHNRKSGTLSSDLILDATPRTYDWRRRRGLPLELPLRTEIDVEATRARRGQRNEPGYCYLMAGWTFVREIPPEHGRSLKHELEAPPPTVMGGARSSVVVIVIDSDQLRAPFPWYGGKSRAAALVWRAFGNVPNYVEPFAGSLAVLLARPSTPKVETANDKDGLIANFWRAVKHAPDDVARWADWPVNEADLHARHRWLVDAALPLTEALIGDPDWYDAKVAGWWVWGICTWIGGGWCYPDVRLQRRRPSLVNAHGHGIHTLARQIPMIGTPGNGVHAPSRKKPLTHRNKGVHRDGIQPDIFEQLAIRLRDVRICCGEWDRVLGRSTLGIDTAHGMTPCGILLDPPYSHDVRSKRLYREDDAAVSSLVRAWALEHGDNAALRIALCGFEGEHDMPSTWRSVGWRSNSSARSRDLERIWFSPHCLDERTQGDLFDPAEASAS